MHYETKVQQRQQEIFGGSKSIFGPFLLESLFNPGGVDSVLSQGGYLIPPSEIHEGVVYGPVLLYVSWTYLEIELTCKKSGKNIKN